MKINSELTFSATSKGFLCEYGRDTGEAAEKSCAGKLRQTALVRQVEGAGGMG
jgi:hypothetical protein